MRFAPIAAALAAALIMLPASCGSVPGYEAAKQELQTRIDALEGREKAVAEQIAALRESKAVQAQSIAAMEAAAADAAAMTPEDLAALHADLEETRERWNLTAAQLDQLKIERATVEGARQATEAQLRDVDVEGAGQAAGGVLDIILAALGLASAGGLAWAGKAVSLVRQIQAAPSRAQGEVDQLWDEAKARAVEAEALKGQLAVALAKLEAATHRPGAGIPMPAPAPVWTGQTVLGGSTTPPPA